MILEVFGLLLALAIVLIALGQYMNIGTFSIVGYIFLLLLSFSMFLPQYINVPYDCIQIRSGANITTTGSTTSVVNTYSCIDSFSQQFYFGYVLFFLSLFSMLFLHWLRKKEKKRLNESYER